MRFQMREMVDSPDAELVTRTLETSLRTQWSDVAREGGIIVLRGLGPTHRINRNDRAVFEVKPAGGGQTAIEADVTYLASALVGDTAPQNELVQRKLDGVLELVRMDIDLARRRAALEGERELKPWLINRNPPTAAAVAETEVEPAKVESSSAERQRASLSGNGAYAWEDASSKLNNGASAHETGKVVSPEVAVAPAPRGDASGARMAEMPHVFPETAIAPPESIAIEQKLVHRGEDLAYEQRDYPRPAKERSTGKIFASLLVIFVLAGAAQMAWQYHAQLGQRMSHWRDAWETPAADSDVAQNPEQKAAEQQATREAAAADAETAVEAAKLAEPDPKKWLEYWAEALRGQDAGTQAAFYADPVEKYFLRRDVSRADVMAARQASIKKQNGSWTLRLDDIVIAEQTDTSARILLVKYIATDGPDGAVEQRLPTQIRLKKINGEWRIVAEQTLG